MLQSKIVREIHIQADELVNSLLNLSEQKNVCLLDSCGVSYLGSHLLIAGINPVKILEISGKSASETLNIFEQEISQKSLAGIFTISYDFGLKIEGIEPRPKKFKIFDEPDVFLALFDSLIVHDYNTGKTFLCGNEENFNEIEHEVLSSGNSATFRDFGNSRITSNFTRDEYLKTIEKIKEHIRCGDTYQTNLTRQIRAELPENLTPQQIFRCLRKNHPAPFSAFIKRKNDFVVSISPERFFKLNNRIISTSPIKGTRPRGKTQIEDLQMREQLLNSAKERAENVMIVDLLRNDIGRVCKFGSVAVEKLCDLEKHPTFFHLVSTIKGELRDEINFSDIIKAVFPCGSITGAPKISTMQIIDDLETANRGLSMGAIGCYIPNSGFQIPDFAAEAHHPSLITHHYLDLSVAIRTMVIKNNEAIFNVGGGIVIDSIPEKEYEETLIKAEALLNSINANVKDLKKN